MRGNLRIPLALLAALALSGCTLAPKYERPQPSLPSDWTSGGGARGQQSAALPDWRQVVADAPMRALIDLSLVNNRDLRVAALKVEKAQAQYRIARADLLPSIAAGAEASMKRSPATLSGVGKPMTNRSYTVGLGFSAFELDFFGRIQSLKDQALESFFATESARRSAELSLVAEVATTYLTLAADREHLSLAREILATERESFEIVRQRSEFGVANDLDLKRAQTTVDTAREILATERESFEIVRQRSEFGVANDLDLKRAQTTVDTARVAVARYQAQVTADENLLAVLVGQPLSADQMPAKSLAEVAPLVPVPAGLPSEVLTRRPDVLAAEHQLKAANASIGAARARYFPAISLTGMYGTASTQVDDLFKNNFQTWTFVPQLTMPIFNAGSIRAGVEVAEADRSIMLAQYEKAVQTAFREVSDCLAQGTALEEEVQAQGSLAEATSVSYELSTLRYEAGVDGYLSKLDAQRTNATARQDLIALRLARAGNVLTLYKALGGGWSAVADREDPDAQQAAKQTPAAGTTTK